MFAPAALANTESLSGIQSARIDLRAVLLQSVHKQSVIAFSLDPVTPTLTAVDNNNWSSVILPSPIRISQARTHGRGNTVSDGLRKISTFEARYLRLNSSTSWVPPCKLDGI